MILFLTRSVHICFLLVFFSSCFWTVEQCDSSHAPSIDFSIHRFFDPSIFWFRVLGTRADPSWLWEAEVHHRAFSIHTHWSVWKVFISVPLIYAPPFLWIWPEQIRTFHPACSNPALHPSFKTYCRWMFCRVSGCVTLFTLVSIVLRRHSGVACWGILF